MPDFAVAAAIMANGKQFLSTFSSMRSGLRSFGNEAKSAFERAIPGGRALSKTFHSIAGQVAIGNLMSRGITRIGHELAQLPKQLEDFAARGQEIGRTSSMIGTTAENYQRLAYAAKLTDTPTEVLVTSMQRLNKNMAEFTVGKGSLKDLAKYGPPGLARQIRGTHDTTEAMMLLADSIANTKDAQVRAAIAQSALGKSGQQLLPFLMQGRAGIHELMKEADKYGSVLTDSVVAASGKFDDNLKRTRGTIDAIRDSLMGYVLRAVNPYLEKARDWLAANRGLIEQKIPEYIDKITEAAKWTWRAVGSVVDTWKRLDSLANGHLARDILLVVAAWKGVRLAIDLAKAAQIAYNIVASKIPVPPITPSVPVSAAPGIGAGAAKWATRFAGAGAAAAGGLGASALIPALGGLAILGTMYYGANEFAKNPTAANLNRNNALLTPAAERARAASPVGMYLAGIMTPAMAQALNQQAEAPNAGMNPSVNVTVPVNVDNTRAPGTNTNVRRGPVLTGAAGSQYGG